MHLLIEDSWHNRPPVRILELGIPSSTDLLDILTQTCKQAQDECIPLITVKINGTVILEINYGALNPPMSMFCPF